MESKFFKVESARCAPLTARTLSLKFKNFLLRTAHHSHKFYFVKEDFESQNKFEVGHQLFHCALLENIQNSYELNLQRSCSYSTAITSYLVSQCSFSHFYHCLLRQKPPHASYSSLPLVIKFMRMKVKRIIIIG